MENSDCAGRKNKKNKKKGRHALALWIVKISILAFALSLVFSSLSETVLTNSGIAVATLVIIFFLIVQYLTDMIGNAVTACEDNCFDERVKSKKRGAREAAILVRNKDRVSSLLCDIIGDICGILSGSAGAAIVAKLATSGSKISILVAGIVTALIASFTVAGKAWGKAYSKNNCEGITLKCGKFMAFFLRSKKKKTKQKKHKTKA